MQVIFRKKPIYHNAIVVNVVYDVIEDRLIGIDRPHAKIKINEKDVWFYLADAEIIHEEIRAGDRVRCINAGRSVRLANDGEYFVRNVLNGRLNINGYYYKKECFVKIHGVVKEAPKKEEPKEHPLLIKLCEKVERDRVGTCSYAIEFKKGDPRFQIGDVCHARLPWAKDHEEATAVALNISGHYKKHPHKEAYLEFVDYAINRSFFSDVFIKKPGKEAIKNGVMMNVDEKASKIYSGAIFLRTGSEYSETMSRFKMLKDMGFSENVAYITSQVVKSGSIYKGSITDSHHFFNGEAVMKDFANAINKKEFQNIDKDLPYRTRCNGIWQNDGVKVKELFTSGKGESLQNWLINKLPSKEENVQWLGKIKKFDVKTDADVVRVAAVLSQILE